MRLRRLRGAEASGWCRMGHGRGFTAADAAAGELQGEHVGGRGTRFSVMWGSPASQLWSGTLRGVSYDLALWVEVPPFAGLETGYAYAVLLGLMDDEVQSDPASAISGLVASLLDRWPALGEAGDEESPWATGPEIGYVSGG